MMYWGHGMGGWGMALIAISTLLFWSLIIAGIVVLVRYTVDMGPPSAESVPQRILAERFARGEIDEDEYRRRRQALTPGPVALRSEVTAVRPAGDHHGDVGD